MCGICGIINLNKEPVNERLVEDMNSPLYHREPDDEGFYSIRIFKRGGGNGSI